MERGLGLQSRLIAGVSPIAAIAAAPPVGFPRLVQYSGAMAPIPVYGGQGQCQPAGPHILLCTAHIIQPRTSLPPCWLDFQLISSVTASPYWSKLSDKHTFRTNGNHDVGQKSVRYTRSSPFNAIFHPNLIVQLMSFSSTMLRALHLTCTHLGQFLQDGKNGGFVSFLCDQT